MLDEIFDSDENKKQHHVEPKSHERINKNTPKEIGLKLRKFKIAKHSSSWLPLAVNNKVSGGSCYPAKYPKKATD